MDTEKIREFITLSRCMSFRAAACELNMSQPALSQHIRDLERELGATLVRRGVAGAPNELTPAGVRFVELGGQILACCEQALRECADIAGTPAPARIQDLNSGYGISGQLKGAFEKHGYSSVSVSYIKTDAPVIDALDAGIVDFVLHSEATPHMAHFDRPDLCEQYGWIALAPERLGVLVGATNPLASRKHLRVADLTDVEVFCATSPSYASWFSTIPRAFAAKGVTIRLSPIPDYARDGGALPLRDDRISVVTEKYANYYAHLEVEDVRFLEFSDAELYIYPFLVYRKDNDAPMVQRVLECMGASQ